MCGRSDGFLFQHRRMMSIIIRTCVSSDESISGGKPGSLPSDMLLGTSNAWTDLNGYSIVKSAFRPWREKTEFSTKGQTAYINCHPKRPHVARLACLLPADELGRDPATVEALDDR